MNSNSDGHSNTEHGNRLKLRWVVTIDGPAGAGKTTVARLLATRLGWRLLDTGAMYRAVTVAAIREATDFLTEAALLELVGRLRVVQNEDGTIWLNGEDVTSRIRDDEVTRASRFVADSPSVRRRLVEWQREFVSRQNTVSEGRDQGTIVFPDALRKYFLTATDAERAHRRHAELVNRGNSIEYEQVLRDQQERDARDRSREIAPMKPAEDAIVFDTTGLTLDTVVDRLANDVQERLASSDGSSLSSQSPREEPSHD